MPATRRTQFQPRVVLALRKPASRYLELVPIVPNSSMIRRVQILLENRMHVKKNLPPVNHCRTVRILHQKVSTKLNQIEIEYDVSADAVFEL